MKNAEFDILGSFNITDRGLVILGKILSGEFNNGDSLLFDHDGKQRKLKIAGINYARMPNGIEEQIGLLFGYQSDSEKESFSKIKVSQQVALIIASE